MVGIVSTATPLLSSEKPISSIPLKRRTFTAAHALFVKKACTAGKTVPANKKYRRSKTNNSNYTI